MSNQIRLKDVCSIQTGSKNTEDKVDHGEYRFFVRSDTVERINSYSFDTEAVLTAGDGVGVGRVFHHVLGKFELHQRVYALTNFNKVNGRFVYHFMRNNFKDYVLSQSAKVTIDSVRLPMIQTLPFPDLEVENQKEIADKIDIAEVKLNTKIELLTQKLHHLEEYKTALIHNAVTKGLDANGKRILDGTPAEEMKWKDSGVEWIGEIPDDWDVCKLKSLADYETGATPSTSNSEAYEGAIPWACISDLGSNNLLLDTSKHITHESALEKNMMLAPKGSLLYSFKLSVGKTSFVENPCYFNEAIACFKGFNGIGKMFLSYVFMSYFDECGFENIYGAKLLNRSVIENAPIAKPSLNEQGFIESHLSEKLTSLIKMEKLINKKVSLLIEYKKSLINEAVSGK